MNTYNKIMLNIWLAIAVVITLFVTYKGFTEGFNRWSFMYVFALLALIWYFLKRFMMKRFEKHMQYLAEQKQQQKNQ